jgi:hypothetical protein
MHNRPAPWNRAGAFTNLQNLEIMPLQKQQIEDLQRRLELTGQYLEQEPIAIWERLSLAVNELTTNTGLAKHEDDHLLIVLLEYWSLRAMIETYETGKRGK